MPARAAARPGAAGAQGVPGTWRLLAVYLLVTMVPVLALGAALVAGYQRQAVDAGREQGRAQADTITQMVVLPALTGDSLELGVPARVQERLQVAADLARHRKAVSRLRLLAFTGRTAFSDDGSTTPLDPTSPAFRAALTGRTRVDVVREPTAGPDRTVRVLQPLLANATGSATGVLELYLPYERIAEAAQSRLREQYLLLACALVLLCAALAAIAWATTRRLRSFAAARDHEARHDALTGLPNRAAFAAELDAVLATGTPGLVALLDLDGFKGVNDTHGHRAGDELLRLVARTLVASLPPRALAARLGGDEFAVLVPGLDDESDALGLLTGVQDVLTAVMRARFPDLPVGASIGGTSHPVHGTDASALLHCADLAMYRAKHESGRAELYRAWLEQDLLGPAPQTAPCPSGADPGLPVPRTPGSCTPAG